jgi:hypothetical protein
VISNIRLQVQQPAEHAAAGSDPGAQSPVQGYAAHYCNIPTHVDPAIVACSMIASGLRVFDIRDLVHPKEIAYFVAPPTARLENGTMSSDFAMSQPAFAPERREVWYTDGTSGLYVLRLAAAAWPAAASPPLSLFDVVRRGARASRVHVRVTVVSDSAAAPLPVAGALVTIAGHHALTDDDGDASILLHTARRQRMRLTVGKDGYRSVRAVVRIGRP